MINLQIPAFLGTNGITATAANYVANMAKESYQALEASTHMQFITETAETFEGKSLTLKIGSTEADVESISTSLHEMARLKSLIAYLREAIKAKDLLTKTVRYSDNMEWVTFPDEPEVAYFSEPLPQMVEEDPHWSEEDVINAWPIEKRVRFLTLQTKVSNLGKLIHEDGSFNKARKRLAVALTEPIYLEGQGKDLIVHKKSASVGLSIIDSKFFELQNEWRELQKEYNSIQHEIELAVQAHNDEVDAAYQVSYSQYCVWMEEYNSHKQKHMQEQRDIHEAYTREVKSLNLKAQSLKEAKLHEVQALKIVLPDALKDLYNSISNMGKE